MIPLVLPRRPSSALRRRIGVKLKWHPRDRNIVFPLKLFDPHEADVAPGSDVVGDHAKADARLCRARVAHAGVALDVVIAFEAHRPGFHGSSISDGPLLS